MDNRQQQQYKFLNLLSMGYMTSVLASVILFPLIVQIWHFKISASLFSYPFTYLFGDLVAEVYGYRFSRRLIWSMIFWANCFSFFIGFVVTHSNIMKGADPNISEYIYIISTDYRYTLAGTIATISGGFISTYIVSKTKILLNGRFFWLRSLMATLSGELANTSIVFFVGMAGMQSLATISNVVMSSYLFKVCYAFPLVFIGAIFAVFLKKSEKSDPIDKGVKFNPFKLN